MIRLVGEANEQHALGTDWAFSLTNFRNATVLNGTRGYTRCADRDVMARGGTARPGGMGVPSSIWYYRRFEACHVSWPLKRNNPRRRFRSVVIGGIGDRATSSGKAQWIVRCTVRKRGGEFRDSGVKQRLACFDSSPGAIRQSLFYE